METSTPENTITYQLTREELVAQLWRQMLRPQINILLIFLLLAGVSFLALGADWKLGWAFLCFPPLFLFFYRQAAHKIVAEHPEFLELQTMSFDDSCIIFTNSVTRVRKPWTRIRGVTDRPEFLAFHFDTLGSGGIVPKRALTADQYQRLLAYASTNAS